MNRVSQERVLRVLCRFESAGADEIAAACGCTSTRIRSQLKRLVDAGLVQRLDQRFGRYSATDIGRQANIEAAIEVTCRDRNRMTEAAIDDSIGVENG